MSNAWEIAKDLAERHSQAAGLFIRLVEDGDKVVGAFCGEPLSREVVWMGDRYEAYDSENSDHKDKRTTMRVLLNFYVPDEGMKIIEGGTVWFKDVLKVREKYGLDEWFFEIERHGDAGNPKTTYSILPEDRMKEEHQAKVTKIQLHDLEAIVEGRTRTESLARDSASASSSEDPLSTASTQELIGQLKKIPRSEVDMFLKEFGVARVRELTVGQEQAAREYIEKLIQSSPAVEDVDPFA